MFNAFNIVFPKFIQCSNIFGMIISYFEPGSIFTIINRLVFGVFNPGGIICYNLQNMTNIQIRVP